MRKADLKDGDLLTARCGYVYTLFLHSGKMCREEGWMHLDDYNEDLSSIDLETEFDIIKVERPTRPNLLSGNTEVIWERSQEVVMTISEIEERLGVSNLKIRRDKTSY